jgi:hypothetical protein
MPLPPPLVEPLGRDLVRSQLGDELDRAQRFAKAVTELMFRSSGWGRVYDPNNELERFKREVNLTELAASLGYRLVQRGQTASGRWRGSSAASISMRHPETDDKVIIRRDRDGRANTRAPGGRLSGGER